jgi:decaprenylphospho-beta-D-ribofuranose 2-oxidase
MRTARAEVVQPRQFDEVAAHLEAARRMGRRVALRAGARSFDDQAMGRDLVIDLSGIAGRTELNVDRREVTVGSPVTWGSIVDATVEYGLIPHILVTTSGATAGGTLSANCLSRFSHRYGRTGAHVRSFDLLTSAGTLLHCSRQQNADVFRAVVGGFGAFGVVTRVTYDLLELGPRRGVRTVVDRCDGLEAFVAMLVQASTRPSSDEMISAVLTPRRPARGGVFRSTFTDEPSRRPLYIHRPTAWYRPLAELLFFLSPRAGDAIFRATDRMLLGRPFVDDLRGYLFCMEGNERFKAHFERAGGRAPAVLPSYCVPVNQAVTFLEQAAALLEEYRVQPALLEALYVPADDWLLSPSFGLASICVSFAFEGMMLGSLKRLRRCVYHLNEACIAAGGRINLIKSVYATSDQLRRMYGHVATDLADLKARIDPEGLFCSSFFARAFGWAGHTRVDAPGPSSDGANRLSQALEPPHVALLKEVL